jgi:hypothetical protein
MSRREGIRRAKGEFVSLIAQYPALFIPYYRLRGKNERFLVNENSEIVIEGFPRSANTFAVVAFSLVQEQPVRMAHHLHAPAQILWAVRREIPVMVLLREPTEAVLSLVMREPGVSLAQGLRRYVRFYTRVAPYRQQFVVAPFEQVTGAFGDVIGRVNAQFGTSFAVFDHSEEQVGKCFSIIEELNRKREQRGHVVELTVARPSAEREKAKDRLRAELEDERLLPLLSRASAAYGLLRSHSGV